MILVTSGTGTTPKATEQYNDFFVCFMAVSGEKGVTVGSGESAGPVVVVDFKNCLMGSSSAQCALSEHASEIKAAMKATAAMDRPKVDTFFLSIYKKAKKDFDPSLEGAAYFGDSITLEFNPASNLFIATIYD